jgi:hypothetical protein
MDKVYLVILEFEEKWVDESQREIRCTTTLEKAKEIFKEVVEQEKKDTWVGEYEEDDFNDYTETDDYFEARSDDYTTIIYIKEVEVE